MGTMEDTEQITLLRVDVGTMKGMLEGFMANQDTGLRDLSQIVALHESRLDGEGAQIARHDERINALEEDNSARWGRVTGILGLIVSVGVALFAFASSAIGG